MANRSERFMLWIDAVGGYWVCLDDEIIIGQAGADADVPVLGDLSGRHARLHRDGEGFYIEALRDMTVDGRPVRDTARLRNGSRIELGRSVCLAFCQPHALSGTVRLDFLSRHRTQPTSDAVIWMAETCILGPRPHSHVVCRQWTTEVLLCRQEGQLFCRAEGEFTIDGVTCRGRGRMTANSRVRGDGFSFNLEAGV